MRTIGVDAVAYTHLDVYKRQGLSTSLLSRWTGFGKMGSAIFGGVMAISMVGWLSLIHI